MDSVLVPFTFVSFPFANFSLGFWKATHAVIIGCYDYVLLPYNHQQLAVTFKL